MYITTNENKSVETKRFIDHKDHQLKISVIKYQAESTGISIDDIYEVSVIASTVFFPSRSTRLITTEYECVKDFLDDLEASFMAEVEKKLDSKYANRPVC